MHEPIKPTNHKITDPHYEVPEDAKDVMEPIEAEGAAISDCCNAPIVYDEFMDAEFNNCTKCGCTCGNINDTRDLTCYCDSCEVRA